MSKDAKKLYAQQWDASADNLDNNNNYSWMCDCVKDYPKILEVGSGTGQSTLALLNAGHKVVSIEVNEYCVKATENRISKAGYKIANSFENIDTADLVLLNGDISDDAICNELYQLNLDLFLCWNIGSYWSKEMIQDYSYKMQVYGLTVPQIKANPESSYAEFIIWQTCKVAKKCNADAHLIERLSNEISLADKSYYDALKDEFKYTSTSYKQVKTKTISDGGRALSVANKVINKREIPIYLTSILYK
ncbi:hypothetical protein [Fusibacter sp. JL216-2]|uniref:hypothetical protein n=1 Tax=Fusibacter sp. JL216-2 TaxID=3071453 RepID=UPI003D32744E